MNCLPPEILSLIVSEIWLCNESLSSISLAVPSTTPFVREHRFKILHVAPTWLKGILDIIDGAEDVSKAIRKVTLTYELEDFALFSRLLSAAVNLEKLVLRGTFTIDWTADLSNLSNSLRTCTRLTSLCITEMAIPRLSDLFQVLHSVPNLTTLTLRWLEISDMYDMMPPSWLSPPPEDPFYRPQWDPDPQDFEAPKPLPRISHLTLQLTSRVWSLMLIDLISSAKTPFPNLQEIVFQDQFLSMYSPRRLPALLKRYRSSLRVLDLADGVEDTVPGLELPTIVEHFKFSVSGKIGSRICQILSSCRASLKIVTMRLDSVTLPWDLQELDKVLACMNLDRWVLEVSRSFEASAKWIMESFALCLKRCADGEWEGGIVWVIN